MTLDDYLFILPIYLGLLLFLWLSIIGIYYLFYFVCDSSLWMNLRKDFKGIVNQTHFEFEQLQFSEAQSRSRMGSVYHSFIIPNGYEPFTVYDTRNLFWSSFVPILSQTLVVSKAQQCTDNFVLTHFHMRGAPFNRRNQRFFPDQPFWPEIDSFRPKRYAAYRRNPIPFKVFSLNKELHLPAKARLMEADLPFRTLPSFWVEQRDGVIFCMLSLNNGRAKYGGNRYSPIFVDTHIIAEQIGLAIDILNFFEEPIVLKTG